MALTRTITPWKVFRWYCSCHPIDVLRTLAHELVHHKQREDGQELNGEDGSNTENEGEAGYISDSILGSIEEQSDYTILNIEEKDNNTELES